MAGSKVEDYDFSEAVRYHYGRFPPETLNYKRLARPLGKAREALARYDAVLRTLPNKDLLLAPLRKQEAVISSRIEGTVATLDEVLQFEAEDGNGGSHVREDIVEVVSYVRALNHAQNLMRNGLPVCGRLLKEAHGKLLFMARGADKRPGEFKLDQNYVVDRSKKKVLFTPISPDQLNDGIKKLELFANDEEIEPLLQTALAHVEFESLHPFNDGNGRVGRMLITMMLWDRKLISDPYFYVSRAVEDRKDEYIERLKLASAEDQWTEWCEFFLDVINRQATVNIDIAQNIGNLYEDMKDQFRRILASQWMMVALDYVFANPVFRNNAFTGNSGIPRPTAARFTKLLSEHGLLIPVVPGSGRRPAIFAFKPLLDIVRSE